MNQPSTPKSLPEDEEMDPVGEPYPNQEPLVPNEDDGDVPLDPTFSPDREPDIPEDPESGQVVQPESPSP